MKKIVLAFLFASNVSYSQFRILVDETFNLKIQSAVELIKENDATSFVIVSDYCDKILISADTIASSTDGIINIPLKVVASPSLNLLASTIVRHSYKLRLEDVAQQLTEKERELLCHNYEMMFQKKLPKEYGNSWKDKFRKIIDKIKNDPYQGDSEKDNR